MSAQSTIALEIEAAIKDAMKCKNKEHLTTLRMLKSAIKLIEIDEKRVLDTPDILSILNKLIKQRQESIKQFTSGERPDLVEKEQAEIIVLQQFLPKQLSSNEIKLGIKKAISETAASSVKDMGKVMQLLKTRWVGQADMSIVSQQVKTLLSNSN